MSFWTSSRIFADLIGSSQAICRRTIFSCLTEVTATRQWARPSIRSTVILNQTRSASKASNSLRSYFYKEVKHQHDLLECKSISDLPTFKDFELKIDEHGDTVFTRTHKGQTVTVWLDVDIDNIDVDWRSEEVTSSDETSDSSDDEAQLAESPLDDELNDKLEDAEIDDDEYLEEESVSQIFHISVTSNTKAAEEVTFICEFTADAVYDDMYEQDIYDILRVGVGKDGITTNEMSAKKMPNDLFEIYYDYLRERGITQEFLTFLRNNFLPSYLHYCFVEHFLKPMENFTKN